MSSPVPEESFESADEEEVQDYLDDTVIGYGEGDNLEDDVPEVAANVLPPQADPVLQINPAMAPVYNDVPRPSAEVITLRRTAGGHKGHITRVSNALNAIIAGTNPLNVTSKNTANRLIQYLKQLEEQNAKLDDVYVKLIALNPVNEGVYLKAIEDVGKETEVVITETINLLGQIPDGDADLPADAGQGGPRTAASAAKANLALKPTELSLQCPPIQLPRWLQQFESFWRTSNLNVLSIQDQQAYFLQYMDAGLRAQLQARISRQTPIYGAGDSCVEALKSLFRERYPTFQRRELFFDLKHRGGPRELPSYLQQLEDLADAADLHNLDRDTLVAYRALSGISDKELRRLCAREENLTLDRFRALLIQRVRESENLHQATEGAARMSIGDPILAATQLKCHYCGIKGHLKAECRKRMREEGQGGSGSGKKNDKYKNKKKNHKKSSYKKGKTHQARAATAAADTESSSDESDSSTSDSSTAEETTQKD